jgi:hypothetical protein
MVYDWYSRFNEDPRIPHNCSGTVSQEKDYVAGVALKEAGGKSRPNVHISYFRQITGDELFSKARSMD